MKKLTGALLLLTLFATGCTSLSTLQDARTTPAGEFTNTISAGSIGAEVTSDGATGVSGDVGTSVSLPMIEWMGRYGINESWDVGVRTSLWAHGVDGKFKIIDGAQFKLSTGLGLNYLSYEIGSLSEKTKITSIDLFVPVYLNYHFNEDFLVYLVPKYLTRKASASGTSTSTDATINYMGGSIGLKYGKLFIEGTMLSGENDAKESVTITQTSIGVTF